MNKILTVGAIAAGLLLGGAADSQAASSQCPASGVCFWNDANFGGGFSWRQPGYGLWNISWRNDDELSSYWNRSDTRAAAYRDANGAGDCFSMNPGKRSQYVGAAWNDKVSSWRTNGNCTDYPAK